MSNDKFFELYKINIACYYNSKKLLKIINDDSTNIPPTLSKILENYELNSDKIKKNNYDNYISHYRLVKTILCRLFNGNREKSILFGDLDHSLTSIKEYGIHKMDTFRDNLNRKFGPLVENKTRIITENDGLGLKSLFEHLKSLKSGIFSSSSLNSEKLIKSENEKKKEEEEEEKEEKEEEEEEKEEKEEKKEKKERKKRREERKKKRKRRKRRKR